MRALTGWSRRPREERGAAALEFALVVIPLLMILGGIVNFGVAFAQQLALDNAVRQAARAAVVDTGADPSAVVIAEWNSSALAATDTPTVTFSSISTCENSTFGDSLGVQADVTTDFLFPWMLPGVPSTVDLHSEAEFQCEFA